MNAENEMQDDSPIPEAEASPSSSTPASTLNSAATSLPRRGRRVLAAFFWLLASLFIMVSGVTIWAHQTVLTSSGWSDLIAGVASDPEVIDNTSRLAVERISDAIGLEDIVVRVLPGDMELIGSAITRRVEEAISEKVAEVAATEGFQDAFVGVNQIGHDAALSIIRDEGQALESDEGTIALNVWPLIGAGLQSLRDAGFIDAERELPDLTDFQPSGENVTRLETLLDRELPDDLGTITLVESDQLLRVQTAVRRFDIITAGLLLLTLISIALALWLSRGRVRMVLWLAIGAIAALAVGRGFTRVIVEDITGALSEGPAGPTIKAIINAAIDQLMWFAFAMIVVALIVAGLALWFGRRAGGTDDDAPTEPVTAASTRGWFARHVRQISYAGLGVIGFFVLWSAAGPELALLAGAAVGVWLIAVDMLGREAAEIDASGDVTAIDPGDS